MNFGSIFCGKHYKLSLHAVYKLKYFKGANNNKILIIISICVYK